MNRIFIVEDDKRLRKELIAALERYQYECQYSDQFEDIVNEILRATSDLILLDLNLPYYDGHHICRELRKVTDVPIIIVTSRDSEVDELISMNLGADDYITKPYNIQILIAHITSVLKRCNNSNVNESIQYNGLLLNYGKCEIQYGGRVLDITKNDMRILKILMSHPNQVISRDDIMNELWQSNDFVDDNTLTVNINRLRHKLEGLNAKNYIKTKRGLGYMV